MKGLAEIIPTSAWEALTRSGVRKVFAPGDTLLRQGDPVDHVLVVVSGRTKVTRVDREGNTLVLAVRGAGEVLGEIGVVDGGERTATVTAIDACVTRVIATSVFADLVRSLGLEGDMLRHVVRRLREGEELRAEAAAFPAGVRVARALLRLAGLHGDRREPAGAADVDIGLAQADLGHAVGLHRSTVAEELRRLRSRGVVATSRSRILILDPEELRAIAHM